MLHAVIMAGGAGTRFWPLSRMSMPKHLQKIIWETSLLEMTVNRISGLVEKKRILVITNKLQVKDTRKVLKSLPPNNTIGEPFLRDTAPCVGLAAVLTLAKDPKATMIVLPSDHYIPSVQRFQKSISAAAAVVESEPDALVTLGMKPTFPANAYGYIERGRREGTVKGFSLYPVKGFKEKPTVRTAQTYLARGCFFWNGGIFLWKAETILRAIKRFLPKHYKGLMKIRAAAGTANWNRVLTREYRAFKKISIDYGVLEKPGKKKVLAVDYRWNDVGSWKSIGDFLKRDTHQNAVHGPSQAIASSGNIIYSTGPQVGLIGVKDLIVVASGDAVLVCHKKRSEEVKSLVEQMKKKGLDELL